MNPHGPFVSDGPAYLMKEGSYAKRALYKCHLVLPGTRRRWSGIYVLVKTSEKLMRVDSWRTRKIYIYIYMESMLRDLLVRFYQEMERDVIRAMQRNQRNMAGRSASGSRG